ncbi:MAG: NAD(P)H-binding protein [Chloroflexaceae bacterium]|nr:NAD(P)H-binding protein [Chloroflexaceae bacterium]
MAPTVLILGGRGRIGRCVAQDLLEHTQATIIATGRQTVSVLSPQARLQVQQLDLDEPKRLRAAIRGSDLVIHCAGPFHYRDGRVLSACIEEGKPYIDVSDHRSYYEKAIQQREVAQEAGVTVILNTGIFPGISNSMVRMGMEQLDRAERVHLSYTVAGSGGAGLTVMRTTFLGLRQRFPAWIDGQWQMVSPYSDRETVEFPPPFGKTGVYWFDMPETYTFPESFQLQTAITKFGSVPDFYNHLTWIAAHVFPAAWLRNPQGIEFLARVSHRMTAISDRFSGIGVALRAEICGSKDGQPSRLLLTLTHPNTAQAAGSGTGSVAQLLLAGKLQQPGIWPVEQILPTDLFLATLKSRKLVINSQIISETSVRKT